MEKFPPTDSIISSICEEVRYETPRLSMLAVKVAMPGSSLREGLSPANIITLRLITGRSSRWITATPRPLVRNEGFISGSLSSARGSG
ncbi:hypothetical protein ES703_125530 [subsurface metagenome]